MNPHDHETLCKILDDPVTEPGVRRTAHEVQTGRPVVVSVANGSLRLCRPSATMATADRRGKLCRQQLRGHGRFQNNQMK